MYSLKSKVILENLIFSNGLKLEILYREQFDQIYPHVTCTVYQSNGSHERFYYLRDKKLTFEEAREWCVKAAIELFEEKQKFYSELKDILIQEYKKVED